MPEPITTTSTSVTQPGGSAARRCGSGGIGGTAGKVGGGESNAASGSMENMALGAPQSPTRTHTWFDAWVESAYGTAGFWRVHDPDEHFRTAAASSDVIAELVASILDQQPEIEAVVDVGAGGGQLLGALAALRPDLRLSGIDLRARPDSLPAQIGWAVDLWDVRYARWTSEAADAVLAEPGPVMIICCEWLDDLPCPVVHQDADGWREVIVDAGADGAQRSPVDR